MIRIYEKYGMLTVLSKKEDKGVIVAKCVCDCGKHCNVPLTKFSNSSLPNCGCKDGKELSAIFCQNKLGISNVSFSEIKNRLGIEGRVVEREFEQMQAIVEDVFATYGICTLTTINRWWINKKQNFMGKHHNELHKR